MRSFTLYNSFVDIFEDNSSNKRIFFNQDTGKVYWRYKIPNLVGTKHSGIYLGADIYGTHYFLHNHYHIGHACLATLEKFSEGLQLGIYNQTCTNNPLTTISIALKQALKKESYNAINYNCQSYTNEACNNHRKSEDVGKWKERLLWGSLLFLGINIAFRD